MGAVSNPLSAPPPNLVELASALIGVFEGCRLEAYQDSGGIWTIGRGHTRGVEPGMRITQQRADEFFAADQAPLFALVKNRPLLEAAALISFGFNCGAGALRQYLAGQIRIEDKIHDRNGNVQPGLVARRRLEAMLVRLSQSK
jgi:lysozyme